MYTQITKCRVCKSALFESILDLGTQALTGIFPKSLDEEIEKVPLELVKCFKCHFVQLRHSADITKMYGKDYGYRSSLNGHMARHLKNKVADIEKSVEIKPTDIIVDIGSNDGTTLEAYGVHGLKYGFDPVDFSKYYAEDISFIHSFFCIEALKDRIGKQKVKVVTALSMFYDLEDPLAFMIDIASVLDDDGIFVLELSYLPTMLLQNSYDTICHEHLGYYSLSQIHYLATLSNLHILDVNFNDINGGSFEVRLGKKRGSKRQKIDEILEKEKELTLKRTYVLFNQRIHLLRYELRNFLRKESGNVLGFGASTKGNVILQFCDIKIWDLPAISEVNADKFGCYTPGTHIPIISEKSALGLKPKFFLVLPWHFKENILSRGKDFMDSGGKFIFPLPYLHSGQTPILEKTLLQNANGV